MKGQIFNQNVHNEVSYEGWSTIDKTEEEWAVAGQ